MALAVLSWAAVLAPRRAAGQTASASAAAAAEALFLEGKRLLDAGRYAEACTKLAESQRLDPGAGTMLNLADCYERNGQLASAWVTFRDAAAIASRTGRTAWAEQARSRADLLEPRVPTITIRVDSLTAPRGIVVTRNGTDVPPAAWGSAIPVDAAEQVVVARAPGKVAWSATVAIGADRRHAVVDIPTLRDEPRPPPPESEREPAPGPRPLRVAALGLLGASGIAAGAGAVLGVTAVHKNDEASARCPASPRCVDPSAVSLTDEARHAATASTIAFIAAGALAAGGGALFLAAPAPREPRVRGGLALAPGACIATLSTHF